jgi:hypothetical protein
MAYVWNNPKIDSSAPGLHALIVGVSRYLHLPGPTQQTFGFGQLETSARTAFQIYQWLIGNQDQLPVPLASIRMMLAPSDKELEALPNLKNFVKQNPEVDGCRRSNFDQQAMNWQADAGTHKENHTWLFFSGHGLLQEARGGMCLMEDFAKPGRQPLTNAITIENIFLGMAPSKVFPNMALSQLYFWDCCRMTNIELDNYVYEIPGGVFLREKALRSPSDNRKASVFLSTLAGDSAIALPNDETVFGKALLECLNRFAIVPTNNSQKLPGQVTSHSLIDNLEIIAKKHAKKWGLDQTVTLEGVANNFTIVFRDKIPDVDLTIEVYPFIENKYTEIKLERYINGKFYAFWNSIILPNPLIHTIPSEIYRVKARYSKNGRSREISFGLKAFFLPQEIVKIDLS